MHKDIAIKVEHVSKKYSKSLKRSMFYGVKDIGRNMLGMSSRSDKLRKSEFWANDDISFEVKKGEVLGIIGSNGSGKTTLLKMLNGIFWPDKGKITIKGKVSALIQVGAGFHPMLTGRENIYINGAVLGMNKKTLDDKFKEIITFANIGDFLDTPVKFYSSGMFVRLGFAIAVHCNPDILLVDEVLAVGDISFQSRCFNKINELKNAGTTIILVSHNLQRISQYANRTLFLNNGKEIFIGRTTEACRQYLSNCQQEQENVLKPVTENPITGFSISPNSYIKDINFKMVNSKGNKIKKVHIGKKVEFHFSFFFTNKANALEIGIIIYKDGLYLAGMDTLADGLKLSVDNEFVKGILEIKRINLVPGKYTTILTVTNGGEYLFRGYNIDFFVESERSFYAGFIDIPHEWNVQIGGQ